VRIGVGQRLLDAGAHPRLAAGEHVDVHGIAQRALRHAQVRAAVVDALREALELDRVHHFTLECLYRPFTCW
jgi:hypothetical protein